MNLTFGSQVSLIPNRSPWVCRVVLLVMFKWGGKAAGRPDTSRDPKGEEGFYWLLSSWIGDLQFQTKKGVVNG